MIFQESPIFFLIGKLWKFSKGNRRNVVLYFILFLLANAVGITEPFIVAKVLNVIQFEGVTPENIRFILLLSSLFIVLHFAFWVFHGPARVIENINAFLARANY